MAFIRHFLLPALLRIANLGLVRKFVLILTIFLAQPSLFAQELVDKAPIRMVKNFIFVQVMLNDSKEPLNFMFDSGAGVTVVEKSWKEKLGLLVQNETLIGTAAGSLMTGTSNGNRLFLGNRTIVDSISLYLMDLNHLSKFLKIKVDGIIGFDLLRKWITETNLDDREMRFYADSAFQYWGTASPVGLVNLESDHFAVPIEIYLKGNSRPSVLTVKIDTGADNYLTIHSEAVKAYAMLDPERKYKKRRGFSVDSTQTTNLKGKIAEVNLGGKRWRNVPVVLEVDPLNSQSKRKADGLIGQELLLDFNIVYHLKKGNIYFEARK